MTRILVIRIPHRQETRQLSREKEAARRVGKLRTKKETVTHALTEFIQRRQQREILKSLGTIEFRKGWDYKKDRRDRESSR
jgi:Arc/MetJ family transcription regulator